MSYYTEWRRRRRRKQRRDALDSDRRKTAATVYGTRNLGPEFVSLSTLALVRKSRASRLERSKNGWKPPKEGAAYKKTAVAEAHRRASENQTSMEKGKPHSDVNLRDNRCKERPHPGRRTVGSGHSRKFIPWCDRHHKK